MPKREQLERMLKDEPNDVFLNYALAKALQSEGRTSDAVVQFRKVLGLDAAHVAAHFQLAQVLAEAGDIDEAKSVLREGITAAARGGDQHAHAEMTGFLETL